MKTLVKVKKSHIKNGIKFGSYSCPVALAIVENDEIDEIVGVGSRSFYSKTTDLYYHLPRSVKRFIKRFDSKKPVKPFSFWFDRNNVINS